MVPQNHMKLIRFPAAWPSRELLAAAVMVLFKALPMPLILLLLGASGSLGFTWCPVICKIDCIVPWWVLDDDILSTAHNNVDVTASAHASLSCLCHH